MSCGISIMILLGGFIIARKLLVILDKEFALSIRKQPMVLWIALFYLFVESFVLNSLWDSVFWITIALVAYNDYLTKEIYDVVYVPAIIICIIQLSLASCTQERAIERLIELIVFCGIQFIVFRMFYGLSDCIAFCVCSMYLTVHGGDIMDSVILMIITILLLGVVQACKKNINRKGNLKEPVALIPYIAVGMMVISGFTDLKILFPYNFWV